MESLHYRDKALKRFRRIWYQDYLLSLREHDRTQLGRTNYAISVEEIVIIKVPNKTHPFWDLGRITHLFLGDNGLVRSAWIERGDGSLQVHSLKHLYPLELSVDEIISHYPDSLPQNENNTVDPDNCPFVHSDLPDASLSVENSWHIWIFPGCMQPDDGSSMIFCDGCNDWYHITCVSIRQPPPVEECWYCQNCLEQLSDRLEDLPSCSSDIPDNSSAENSLCIWICPGCSRPDDGSHMICCDGCNDWYHRHSAAYP